MQAALTAKKQNPNSYSLRCLGQDFNINIWKLDQQTATLQSFWAKEKATKSEGFQLQTNFLH